QARIAKSNLATTGYFQVFWSVDDDDLAISHDACAAPLDNDCRTFINTDHCGFWIIRQHTEKSIVPATVDKMLINDRMGEESHAFCGDRIVALDLSERTVPIFFKQGA